MNSSAQQPMIVKYLESLHNGIQSQILSRYAIGYILRGTKYIYDGDKRQTLARGDVFYLGLGHHYIENVPDGSQPYEEVLFYYTPEDLQRILMHLPQHLALHQTLQEGVPDDSGNLPPPPPELPNGRGSGSCRRRGSRAGKGCGKRRGALIKNLRTERKLKNLNYNMV